MTQASNSQTLTALRDMHVTPRDGAWAVNALPLDQDLPVGTIIGDFQIESLLGRGGLSRVYRARQRSLDRTVALKVTLVREEHAHGTDEGRTMAAVVHDHIVPVFSEQTVGEFRLLAMGFIAGPTLAEFLAEQRDTHNESRTSFACRTIRDLAQALAHAHRLGVLHCDIKPANILFTPDGRALLTDFNVAVRRDGVDGSNHPVGGTLSYMAPEHLAMLTGRSAPATVDERADLYSLGLVLFELLTGTWPFAESEATTDPLSAAAQLQAIRLASPVRFPATAPRLAPSLQSIVQKCLAPQPADRYRTADELADDLDRYLTHRPLRFAMDPSLRERATNWVRRHPAWTVTVVASVLIGALAIRFENNSLAPAPAERASVNGPISIAAARHALEWDRRGCELLTHRRFEDALRCFDQAVAFNSQLAPAHHNRGVARFRLGHFSSACESFDRAAELGNTTGLLFSHRAAVRFALGDIAGAETDFTRAKKTASASELAEVLANILEFETLRAATP